MTMSDLNQDLDLMQVWLWDLGPTKPVHPERPEPPVGKEGTPLYDLKVIEWREEKENYDRALLQYREDKERWDRWQRDNGGPVEIPQYSVNAREAMERDPKRYTLSARTRGHGQLANRGLPLGMKPGHGQKMLEERQRQGLEDLDLARRGDPFFGEVRR